MRNALYLLLLLTFCLNLSSQTKKKVLFIGNSYTYVNNLPQLVADIALSKSDTVVYDSNTPGGYTFNMHSQDATTLQKIKSQQWDVVILQAQSQEPAFSPSQVMSQTYPYAKKLCDSIRANNPCTEILFYMTWGRKNGDASNCGFYAPVCTYIGMQARLRESYMMFSDSFQTSVAPVGVAWKNFRNAYPTIDLYQPDESHPSLHGSYLAACVFYSSIFKKTSVGSSYNPSLPSADLANIQTISSQTVLDSVSVWNLGSNFPKADFTYSISAGFNCQFTNQSKNAKSFSWSFGSTLKNPTYNFPGAGTYTVQLKSTNQCTSDSLVKSVTLTGISELSLKEPFSLRTHKKVLEILNHNPTLPLYFTLSSIEGKQLVTEYIITEKERFDFNAYSDGIYLVSLKAGNHVFSKKVVLTTD